MPEDLSRPPWPARPSIRDVAGVEEPRWVLVAEEMADPFDAGGCLVLERGRIDEDVALCLLHRNARDHA